MMQRDIPSIRGVTLLEIMLVLVIAASFILLGLQTFRQFSLQGNINKASYNVNVLFKALRGYYLSNCIANRTYDTGAEIKSATLDPSSSSYISTASVGINIASQLVTPGYLTNWQAAFSPVVASYVVQLNRYNTATKTVQFCYSGTCVGQPTVETNNVYLWTAQVAIQINDVARINQYKEMLGADCISRLSGSIVTPCSQSPVAANFLVFERLPSFVASEGNSPLWLSMPNVKQFKEQYTNDNDYAITVDDPSYRQGSYQNYLCGG